MTIKIILAAAALLGLFLGWVLSSRRRLAARHDSVKKLATALGCDLEEYGPETALLDGTGLPFFLEARKGVGRNMLRFTDDGAFEARFFDYAYLGAGDSKAACTVALFDFKKDLFPGFFLSPDASGVQPQLSGFEAMDAKGVPGLPEGARLYTADPARTAALLNKDKAALFAAEPEWNAQAGGSWLLLYKTGQLAQPGSYHIFMDSAKKMAWRLTA